MNRETSVHKNFKMNLPDWSFDYRSAEDICEDAKLDLSLTQPDSPIVFQTVFNLNSIEYQGPTQPLNLALDSFAEDQGDGRHMSDKVLASLQEAANVVPKISTEPLFATDFYDTECPKMSTDLSDIQLNYDYEEPSMCWGEPCTCDFKENLAK